MLSAVVLGGGVAGIGTALKLAEKGYKVAILEKRESCLASSSDNTPCRLGLGFHYSDLETEKSYLYASLSVLKKYKNFVVAKDEDQSHPLRRGRYFITQDSHFSASKILALYEQLREEYKSAIEKDPSNKLLGDPEDSFKELSIDAYSDKVKVKIGIETAEQILDWPSLKQHLLDEVKNNPNIHVVTYIDRYFLYYNQISSEKNFLNKLNIHNMLLTSSLITHKYLHDKHNEVEKLIIESESVSPSSETSADILVNNNLTSTEQASKVLTPPSSSSSSSSIASLGLFSSKPSESLFTTNDEEEPYNSEFMSPL